jgi:FAD/FMN-containing dehydrogenase
MSEGLDPRDLAKLRSSVLGPVLTPDDGGYEQRSPFWIGDSVPRFAEAVKIWNGLYDDARPAVIVQCQVVADVQSALAFARENDLTVAIRGGGHTPSGASTIEGGLVIDLSRRRGVSVDLERRTAIAGAGCLLAELDRETQVHGLATPAGAVSHTGVAGLTLYGGIGRLMRKHGLTVDNVIGFNVVTADGEALRVDADNHVDLYWALRGGGGNFCVVTHFEYQLHPIGPLVYGGYLGWPIAQAQEVFRQIHELVANAPDELHFQFIFTHGPEAEFLPPQLQGELMLMVVVTWLGADLEEGARYIEPMRRRVPPALNAVGDFPYAFLQSAADSFAPHGRLMASTDCRYLHELTDQIVTTAVDEIKKLPTKHGVIEITLMGGAVARVPADVTPLGLFRDAGYFYIVSALATDPAEVDACREWTASAGNAFSGFDKPPGGYLNFISDHSDDSARDALGEATWSRLQAVKSTYDPGRVFAYDPSGRPEVVATT